MPGSALSARFSGKKEPAPALRLLTVWGEAGNGNGSGDREAGSRIDETLLGGGRVLLSSGVASERQVRGHTQLTLLPLC